MTLNEFFLWLVITLPSYATTLTIILALLLDKCLGEAKSYHYLVGFGWLADQLEKRLNAFEKKANSEKIIVNKKNVIENCKNKNSIKKVLLGAFAWAILVLPIPIIYFLYLNQLTWYWQILLDASVLYLAIGLNSLYQHAMQVYHPLSVNNLSQARHFTGYLVSRETAELMPNDMSRATVESMLENGHDSVIASIVYFIIGGAPLVIIHRFANTLDAMWGYKTQRFNAFGFASAKLDDLLGFISAKICTLLYAVQGNIKLALTNAYTQGNKYKSHNGGWVIAAGATVMNVKLGGFAQYHGKIVESVSLGCGNKLNVEDIPNSVSVVNRATIIITLLVFLMQLVSNYFLV